MNDLDEAPPAQILAASEDGLSAIIEGVRQLLSWQEISSISGGTSKRDDNLLFLSIGIDDNHGERVILVCENEPVWQDLLEHLHVALPVAPLEAWAMGSAAFPGAYTLYRRQP